MVLRPGQYESLLKGSLEAKKILMGQNGLY